MKNLIIISLLVVSFSSFGNNKYKLNMTELDAMFEQAVEVTNDNIFLNEFSFNQPDSSIKEKNAWTAFALSLAYYFTGWGGLHRVYLGAGAGVFLAYFCTGGGFGILQTVDTIILFVAAAEKDGDISSFVDNKNLFMW